MLQDIAREYKINNNRKAVNGSFDEDEILDLVRKDEITNFVRVSLNSQELFKYKNGSLGVLEIAALFSSIKIFRFLLSKGYNVTEDTLEFAMKGGNIEIIDLCLEKLDVNVGYYLDYCLEYGRNDVADWIINTSTEHDIIDIHNCCKWGNFAAVIYCILYLNISVNCLNSKKQTPLHVACISGELQIVEFLVSRGAIVNHLDEFGVFPIDYAAENNYRDVVEFLISNSSEYKSLNKLGLSTLHHACYYNSLDVVKLLIETFNVDCNIMTKDSITPLIISSSYGFLGIVKYLLSLKNIDILCRDANNKSALDYSIENGYNEIEFTINCYMSNQ